MGKFTWKNQKAEYIGEYVDDFRNGIAKMKHSDGSIYIGQWLNDKKNGCGKFIFADKSIYEGEFEDDDITGYGKFTWPEGIVESTYEGYWVNGQR